MGMCGIVLRKLYMVCLVFDSFSSKSKDILVIISIINCKCDQSNMWLVECVYEYAQNICAYLLKLIFDYLVVLDCCGLKTIEISFDDYNLQFGLSIRLIF